MAKYNLGHIPNAKDVRIKPPFSWYTLIATWFYTGMAVMPGTIGSLATYPLYFFALRSAHTYEDVARNFWIYFGVLFVIGWPAVKKYQTATNTMDHKSVVIDEVLGMLLAFALCFKQAFQLALELRPIVDLAASNIAFLIVFATFRFFDINKPFIIGYIDRRMSGALAVILDDLAAALFTFCTIIVSNGFIQMVM